MTGTSLCRSAALVLSVICASPARGQGGAQIVHDAEYYILEAQNGDAWRAEDRDLNDRLAELRRKHGRPP
ncbi:MAG: hypothetical protein GY715_13170, partial [Planctomycetes bacterium]|nr:hypothetical protein [Planctomycetota bacterium]